MIEPLSFIIFLFLLGFLVFSIWLGIKLFSNIANTRKSNSAYNEETYNRLRKNSIEDSQGDGLMLFNDPLFPEETDEDDDF
jgi:hypothetical protein